MRRLSTRLVGPVLLQPAVHGDERAFLSEPWREDGWAEHGVPARFVQDNHSRSRRGTVRGIHFQTHPGQGKLVRCARGSVLDVVVDLRRGSETLGEWQAFELDDVHGRQLWIPVGIDWPADIELLYSQRDREAPRLAEVADTLPLTV